MTLGRSFNYTEPPSCHLSNSPHPIGWLGGFSELLFVKLIHTTWYGDHMSAVNSILFHLYTHTPLLVFFQTQALLAPPFLESSVLIILPLLPSSNPVFCDPVKKAAGEVELGPHL